MITTRNVNVQENLRPPVRISKSEIKKNWKILKNSGEGRVSVDKIASLELDCVQRKITEDPIYAHLEKTDKSLFFDGANGFGDSFFQRVVIKYLIKYFKTIYLHTPCPDIFWDIPNLKFVNEGHNWLRTQKKTADSVPKYKISKLPKNIERKPYEYCPVRQLTHCSAWIIRRKLGIKTEDFNFEFPVKPRWISAANRIVKDLKLGGKKLCIIRPSTRRKEWDYPTRNPKLEYFQLLIDKYKDEYFYVSLADLKPNVEWLDGELKGIDAKFHKGEIPLSTIFGLMKISDMILTYPAFFMLAGIAIRAKTFSIWGGCSNPAASLEDSMGLDNFSYVAPDPACNCFLPNHSCNKEIPEKILFENFEKLKNRKLKSNGGNGKNCDVCYTKKDFFKPMPNCEYTCSSEATIFECIDKEAERDLCLWDNPAFKRVERGG